MFFQVVVLSDEKIKLTSSLSSQAQCLYSLSVVPYCDLAGSSALVGAVGSAGVLCSCWQACGDGSCDGEIYIKRGLGDDTIFEAHLKHYVEPITLQEVGVACSRLFSGTRYDVVRL